MRRASGKFKAISGAAKKSFYHSKRVVPSSGKEGSEEGVLVCVLVGFNGFLVEFNGVLVGFDRVLVRFNGVLVGFNGVGV